MPAMSDIVLVTGGAGFIGSHLVEALLRRGYTARVLDNFSSGRDENLDHCWALAGRFGGGLQVIQGDVRDPEATADACYRAVAVVHLAAVPSVTQSLIDPVSTNAVTHGGTINVLWQAVAQEVPLLVLASSCAVYGDATTPPIPETARLRPRSPYAEAKRDAELACVSAGDGGFVASVCLRFFNVYGPRQDPTSPYSGVVSRFLSAAWRGQPLTIHGDGEQTRDFVYVGDVVQAILRVLERPRRGATVLNVGSGRETSVNELAAAVERVVGRRLPRRQAPPREGDVLRSAADPGRARWVLGWEAVTPLDEGLAATWQWVQEEAAAAAAAEPRGSYAALHEELDDLGDSDA